MSHKNLRRLTRLAIAVAMTSALAVPAFIGPSPDDSIRPASLSRSAATGYGDDIASHHNSPGGHLEDSWSGQ